MNLYEFALKMETDGKAYYDKLASETQVPGLKAIFDNLAADEQKHYDTITRMWESGPAVMACSSVLETSRNIFHTLTKDDGMAAQMKKSLDGYQHAMKIEAESVRLYEELAGKEKDPAARQLLLSIADEERKHYNIMDNLSDYTLAPQNFLAWAEFSNLTEL